MSGADRPRKIPDYSPPLPTPNTIGSSLQLNAYMHTTRSRKKHVTPSPHDTYIRDSFPFL